MGKASGQRGTATGSLFAIKEKIAHEFSYDVNIETVSDHRGHGFGGLLFPAPQFNLQKMKLVKTAVEKWGYHCELYEASSTS